MLRAFLKAPGGIASLVAMALLLAVAVVAPILWSTQAETIDVVIASEGPSLQHLLGTDALGRDVLLRILVATRLSLVLALSAAALGAAIGIPLGAGAALLPPRLRSILLRTIDALIVFPGILVAIIVATIVGTGAAGAVIGVGIGSSFAFARVASTLTLSVSGREYIAAARVAGIRGRRLLFRYVLPNIGDTLAITTTVVISGSIVAVSALSFLNLGVQPPAYDWGALLTEGLKAFYFSPAAALGTVGAIAISSITFGFAGEALARASNPVLWARQGNTPSSSTQQQPEDLGPPIDELVDDPVTPGGDPVLQVADLAVEFAGPGEPLRVVDGISFSVGQGEILGIVGESGSGKTMTAMAIADLIAHPGRVEGTVRLSGQDVREIPLEEVDRILGTQLAVVFQDPLVSLNPALRVGRQLTEGVEVHAGTRHRDAVALAVERLAEVGLPTPGKQMARYPHELSGGMRQRAMIAMGLMHQPSLLLADEPTTALDVTAQAQIMDLLWRVNHEHGTAVVLISHNLGLVSQNCDRVLVMYAGRVIEELTAEQLTTGPLHPYTRALVRALPDAEHEPGTPLASIPGQVPDFADLPSGCPYHPRCPLATDRCRTSRPPLRRQPTGQRVACWAVNGDRP